MYAMATDPITIQQRYASAVHTSDLTVDPNTHRSSSDVLGAFGIAAKRLESGWVTTGEGEGYSIPKSPLTMPLARLLAGDNNAAHEVVEKLGEGVFAQSWVVRVKITRGQAQDIAKACLAWHRDGTCKPCGGHGKTLIPGTKTLSDHRCEPCGGVGRIPFETQFQEWKGWPDLARWAVGEMERALGKAGPMAMQAISERL